MTKEELKVDWLNWFKLSVHQAAKLRTDGEIERAQWMDSVVQRYYGEDEHNWGENKLYEIESKIRNEYPL